MEKTYLMTTKSCQFCPMVKALIEEKGLDIEYLDAENEGTNLAGEAMVMSVPSIIVVHDDELETHIGQQAAMAFVNSL